MWAFTPDVMEVASTSGTEIKKQPTDAFRSAVHSLIPSLRSVSWMLGIVCRPSSISDLCSFNLTPKTG